MSKWWQPPEAPRAPAPADPRAARRAAKEARRLEQAERLRERAERHLARAEQIREATEQRLERRGQAPRKGEALTPEERAYREARQAAARKMGFLAHLVPYVSRLPVPALRRGLSRRR